MKQKKISYKFPDHFLNAVQKQVQEKPKTIRKEWKRAYQAYRVKKKFPFKLSTIKLSYMFQCSEKLICEAWKLNDIRNPIQSEKIFLKTHSLNQSNFDNDYPF